MQIHVDIWYVWIEPGTAPDNVVMAEMPHHSDTSSEGQCKNPRCVVNAIHHDALKANYMAVY